MSSVSYFLLALVMGDDEEDEEESSELKNFNLNTLHYLRKVRLRELLFFYPSIN